MQFELSKPIMWSERNRLPDEPGVYVISKGEFDNIVYIGETTAQKGGLKKRVGDFHRATQDGKSKHSGGRTFHRVVGIDVSDLLIRFHAADTTLMNSEVLGAYIKLAERALIWKFVEEQGRIPICNHK